MSLFKIDTLFKKWRGLYEFSLQADKKNVFLGSTVKSRKKNFGYYELEVDDKVIAVLADDKRMDHIHTFVDLGEHWLKETKYYWEHYKDLKKPGTCSVNGFYGIDEAVKVIQDCENRYKKEIDPKLVN